MRRGVAIVLSIGLALYGCGDGDESTDADRVDTGVERAVEEEAEPDAEERTETPAEEQLWQETPLAEFFGWGEWTAEDEAYWQEQDRQRQELVAECMAEQGFEWVPVDYSQYETYWTDPFEGLTEEERIDQYGFGMSTMFEYEQEMMAQEPEFEDPNWEIQQSLSPAEEEAYNRTLYGEEIEWEEDDPRFDPMSEEFDPELMMPRGCWGEAAKAMGDYERELAMMRFDSEFNALYEGIENDPRMVAAQRDWATCMAEAGYLFENQEEMFMDLDERMMPIWESQNPFGEMSDWEIDELLEGMSPEEQDEFFSQEPTLSPEEEVLLAEIQEYEIALARADYDCAREADLEGVRYEVTVDHEQSFVDAHRAELEDIRDAQGS